MTDTPERIETTSLTNFICFAVYSANLAFSRVYKPILEALGLTYPQYITLIALWEEGELTVKGLSERLFLEPSTMTPMLKRLEAMGYVTRRRGTEDERVVYVALTEEGRKVREKGIPFGDVTMKATGLPLRDMVRLQKDIIRLRDNLMAASKDN